MRRRDRVRRSVLRIFWRLNNPLARQLAGFAPWWVLVETIGNRTGRVRRTPLASGPLVDDAMLLIAVHGRHSGWIRNVDARPAIRVKHRGRWRDATATVEELRAEDARRFGVYARMGPRLAGIDPMLVRVHFDQPDRASEGT